MAISQPERTPSKFEVEEFPPHRVPIEQIMDMLNRGIDLNTATSLVYPPDETETEGEPVESETANGK